MSKIISQIMVSVDGFYEGNHHELDWHQVDEEYNEYATEMLQNVSAILFGRKTYQLMEQYWPTAQSEKDSQVIADLMNQLPKIVFSKTLESVKWNQSVLIKEKGEQRLKELKTKVEKDLIIFGSGELVSFLTNARLIDEYHIIINPLILAKGKPFFRDISEKIPLKLVRTKTFKSGNILLCYQLV